MEQSAKAVRLGHGPLPKGRYKKSVTIGKTKEDKVRDSLRHERRTRKDCEVWTKTDPTYHRPKAEPEALWDGWRITNVDTSGRASDVTQSPDCYSASELRREHSHATENHTLISEQPTEISERGDKKQHTPKRVGQDGTVPLPRHCRGVFGSGTNDTHRISFCRQSSFFFLVWCSAGPETGQARLSGRWVENTLIPARTI